MSGFPWIAVAAIMAILATVWIFVAFMIQRSNKGKAETETNYHVFFVMGVGMAPIGDGLIIASIFVDLSLGIGIPFLTIGIAYTAIGAANRDKWKKREHPLPPARLTKSPD